MRFTLGITIKYIDRHPTASMTNNPLAGNHPRTPKVLSCEQQITALSKAKTKRYARGYLHTPPSTFDSKCINQF
jgi:hypothetical protein